MKCEFLLENCTESTASKNSNTRAKLTRSLINAEGRKPTMEVFDQSGMRQLLFSENAASVALAAAAEKEGEVK